MMTTLTKILSLTIILIFFCFFFGVSLQEDGNERSNGEFVSTTKMMKKMEVVRGRKLMMMSGDKEFSKKTKTMKREKTRERKSREDKSAEEDGLVAYTADYWRAKHHPPKNN